MAMVYSDYVQAISEEIALEGLDGITIEALWRRLDDRPNFLLRTVCDKVKHFIWKIVLRLKNVDFYRLSEPRPTVQVFDRYSVLDDLGHYVEPEAAIANASIYPHNPIDKDGVRGSCSTYDERVDITNQVKSVDLDTAIKRWGNKLVIVADQATRLASLCSSDCDPEIELQINHYCMLERIGRSRFQGEITQGKSGLQIVPIDARSLFYVCKILMMNGFITKKSFACRIGKQLTGGRVIHLTKFAVDIKTKRKTMIESIMEYLKENPVCLYRTVQVKFTSQHHAQLKKLIAKYSEYIKSEVVPYREFYPDAKTSEWKTKSGAEKQVRLIKLINPELKNSDDEEDDEDDTNYFVPIRNQRLDISVIRHCYQVVEQSGKEGLTQNDVRLKLGVTNLHARALMKYAVLRGLVTSTFVDEGRQRKRVYHSKFHQATAIDQIQEEKDKLLKTYGQELVTEFIPETKTITLEQMNEAIVQRGPEPIVQVSVYDNNEIETKITCSFYNNDARKLPSLFTEVSSSVEGSSLTARTLKRVNLILQTVQTHRVITDYFKLLRFLNEEEAAEGSVYLMDRKTVQRLLHKLEMDGLIKIIQVSIKGHGKEKNFNFICHPSVNEHHVEIQSALEQAKMKLPIANKPMIVKPETQDIPRPPTHDPKAGRKYGLKPKFVRMQILHTYMYYLTWGYEGSVLEKSEVMKVLNGFSTDESLLDELPPVFAGSQNWKMFIPPLLEHTDFPRGWALMSDLIVRLPLVLFVSLVSVNYDIPLLMDYLNHPIKKYYLVKHLPADISNLITYNRKFIFAISECVSKLCFLGLVQMGPQKLKDKDQIFVYINKHGLLLDTTVSESGYNHISEDTMYEQTNYSFKTLDDVEQYWFDLWNFAMNTNLGCRNIMTGKPVVVESVSTKSILQEATSARSIEEAENRDVGYLPGDRLGAAGLDSDLFVHLKRNWYWNKTDETSPTPRTDLAAAPSAFHQSTKRRSLGRKSGIAKKAGRTDRSEASSSVQSASSSTKAMAKTTKSLSIKTNEPLFKSKAKKNKKVTRIVKPKTMKGGRKPYYDQIDREALGNMDKLRVGWSQVEDNLLLLCKVASLYMSSRRYVAKNFFLVREILYTNCPELSKNKTSRACQRRMLYMMKNPSTAHSVYLCLEEIKQDPDITDKFSSAVATLDAKLKAQGEGPKGFQGEYDKIFKNLVAVLLKKLKMVTHSDAATLDNMTIPDTLDEFKSRYEVVIPKCLNNRYGQFNEVQNTVDIMCSVVNCIIHSSLCSIGDKTAYSYQLFYVYQQYPDKLLRSVMGKCRSMQLVSCRKRYQKWKIVNSACLPLSSCPYQLSITYINILQTRYQYQIFSENFASLTNYFQAMDQSELFKINSGGDCAAVVELFSSNIARIDVEIPETAITLDPRLSDTEESYTLIMKRFKDILDSIKAAKKDTTAISEDEQEEDEDTEKGVEINLNKTVLATMASRVALYMLRDDGSESLDKSLQHAHDYFVLKPCKVFLKINKDEYCSRRNIFEERKTEIISEINRLTHFPQNHAENEAIIEDMKNYPTTCVASLLHLIETKKELGATYKDILGSQPELIYEQWHDVLIELSQRQFILKTGSVDVRFVHNKYSKPWLVRSCIISRGERENLRGSISVNSSHVLKIRDDVDESTPPVKKARLEVNEESPVDSQSQKEAGGENDRENGAHSSEVVVFKPRKHDRKRKWATLPKENKFEQMDLSNMEPVQISIRPWIKIDGTLNRRVLDRQLGSVLGLILSAPGVSVKKLQERLTPALQPHHSLELVEILGKIECVYTQTVVKTKKPSLISKKSSVSLKPAVGYEDPNLIMIHPTLLAITRLGEFIGMKNYSNDYLDLLH